MAVPIPDNVIVVEVFRGVVQAVYTDLPLKVVLVDWDNINEEGSQAVRGGYYRADRLEQLPNDTAEYVGRVVDLK